MELPLSGTAGVAGSAAGGAHGGLSTSPWVRRWSGHWAPGTTALDVACGSGRHVRHLAGLGLAVTGIDRDAAALTPLAGIAETHVADIEAGPWPMAGLYDFQTPRAAIQVNNEIWVTDQGPNVNAIFRFDHDGGFLGRIGGNTAGGGLSNVRGIRFIDGVVYAVNAGTDNGAPGPSIVRIATDGTILGSFSTLAGGGTIGASPLVKRA